MKPIHVLVLITVMDRAGAETVMMNYMRNIDRNLIKFDFLINRLERAEYEDEIESLGGKVYHMGALYPGKFHKYKKEIRQFFNEHPEYQIVHSHLEERSFYALKAAKEAGVPVRICHGHSHPKHVDIKLPMRYYFRARLKKYYTHMMACNEDVAKWLFGKKKIKEVIIAKNAIDTTKFKKDIFVAEEVEKELRLENKLVVGHVGRFIYEKNQEFLLEVFSELHKRNANSTLVMVGGGDNKAEINYKEKMQQKVRELRLENEVIFTGVRADVNRIMQVFDVLIMPSKSEGFPVTLVEAQSMGIKCVVSDVISQRCNLTRQIEYLPLELRASVWAARTLEFINKPIGDKSQKVIDKGYDIKSNVRWLQKFYISELKKQITGRILKRQKNKEVRMKILKLWYHIKAVVKKAGYKLLYGEKVKFGRNTTFRAGFQIMAEGKGHIRVGKNCFFNNWCSINSLEEVTIGDGTIFGENVHVYDHNHRFRSSEDSIKSQGYTIAPVHIGNHVWIGTNSVILKGVTIGDNAVIGAGCVVDRDIPTGVIITCGTKVEVKGQDK